MSEAPEKSFIPQIHHMFKAKDLNSDNIIKYRVQDLPEEYYEQTVDFMVKYFLPDEPISASLNLCNKPGVIKKFRKMWHKILKQKLSIGCFKNDGTNKFVGANILLIRSKDDPEEV